MSESSIKKVLIIDDSLLERKLQMNTIRKGGFEDVEVLQAGDGEEGIRLLSENIDGVRLILLDWQMPKMNGIEFMKAIINVPEVAEKPVIMITASSSDEDRKLAYATNPNLAGYIVKPYKPDKLVAAITPYLSDS